MIQHPYPPEFEKDYETHLKRLTLNGMRPKTIEAYSMALRRIGHYFNHQINDLSEAQLTEYFSDLLITHSWSTLKHDMYGLKFYYDSCCGGVMQIVRTRINTNRAQQWQVSLQPSETHG